MDSLFTFAANLARAQAASLMADSPTRVGAPEEDPARPDFATLPMRKRLAAVERICRRATYAEALAEALPESPRYDALLKMAIDPECPDIVIGALVRELIVDYVDRVAERCNESLADFL